MATSRDDFGIVIRSALLSKGTKQKFSLLALIIISILLIFLETIEAKPLNYFRSFLKDVIYRGSIVVTAPTRGIDNFVFGVKEHVNLYTKYKNLKTENEELKNSIYKEDFLRLENSQLRKLIEEDIASDSNLVSARVMIDKQSPYINSFILNIGSNKNIKNGMAVLWRENFVGRVVDVNFFSSRVLLVTDLNSRIPVIIEPTGSHAILSGHGTDKPTLDYLPENNSIDEGDKIYTSGKEGIFKPGIPVGIVKLEDGLNKVKLLSDLDQITFVNIDLTELNKE